MFVPYNDSSLLVDHNNNDILMKNDVQQRCPRDQAEVEKITKLRERQDYIKLDITILK